MNTQIEKVYDLLKRNAENVSANHWINAIHEDKFEILAREIVLELRLLEVVKEHIDEKLCQHSWVKHPAHPKIGAMLCLKCGGELA